jgi:hypothetical protein
MLLMFEMCAQVELARQHIVDELLTLHCPRCSAAFVDFSGCFALTCHRCSCGFCGWCLGDCGADAHAHVLACPHNAEVGKGGYFGTQTAFQNAQTRCRQRNVTEYVRGRHIAAACMRSRSA